MLVGIHPVIAVIIGILEDIPIFVRVFSHRLGAEHHGIAVEIRNVVFSENLSVHTAVVVTGNDCLDPGPDQALTHGLDLFSFQTANIAELDFQRATQQSPGRILLGHSQFQGHLHLFAVTGVRTGQRHGGPDVNRVRCQNRTGAQTENQPHRHNHPQTFKLHLLTSLLTVLPPSH